MSQASAEAAPDEEDDLLDDVCPYGVQVLSNAQVVKASLVDGLARRSRLGYQMFIEVWARRPAYVASDDIYHDFDLIHVPPTIVRSLVKTPLRMYLHQRVPAGGSNHGWLRNMYHSTGQQLVRMDPAYYYWYVVLRPDHCWRLIPYPYYAKYSRKGDPTFFNGVRK
ncbi:hypothetical protein BDV30DRAFT_240209 [Aspergillus minisclerotigenes]|uniref:Uncharacterized protein n=1 Tax=Aspergillus minisclerotigenes TaxID=656917 RepID=A0A5N6IZD1_9EURO|nr:hypothetical protein BDV30DRAFT_240209 [Aspergillus minisclerotigenes]